LSIFLQNKTCEDKVAPRCRKAHQCRVNNDRFRQRKDDLGKHLTISCTVNACRFVKRLADSVEKSLGNVVTQCCTTRIHKNKSKSLFPVFNVTCKTNALEDVVDCHHAHKSREHTQNQ